MPRIELDRIDFDLIANLQNNARIANKVLADRVGLAPSTCLERVRRLREAGVLQGAHESIDRAAVGIGLEAMIFVRLSRHTRSEFEDFHAHLTRLEEVLAIYHVAGVHDFLVHVAVRDVDHLRDLAMDAITTRPEVAQLETHLIFSRWRNWQVPIYRME